MFTLTYQEKTFNQRESDGYVNLGQLCATHDKLFADWNRLKSSEAYLKALETSMGIPIAQLLIVQNGNASWGHPLIALEVARWISPEFGVWCNMHIKLLMENGKTELTSANPYQELPVGKMSLTEINDYCDRKCAENPNIVKSILYRKLIEKFFPELGTDDLCPVFGYSLEVASLLESLEPVNHEKYVPEDQLFDIVLPMFINGQDLSVVRGWNLLQRAGLIRIKEGSTHICRNEMTDIGQRLGFLQEINGKKVRFWNIKVVGMMERILKEQEEILNKMNISTYYYPDKLHK